MRSPITRIERVGGLFILAALVVLGAVLLVPGLLSGSFLRGRQLQVRASEGVGLVEGSRIIMRGIEVGRVAELRIDATNYVILRCEIHPAFRDKIRTGIRVVLVPAAILGSPFIRIDPAGGELLPPDTVIDAVVEASLLDSIADVSLDLRQLVEKATGRMDQLQKNLESVQRILDALNERQGLAGKLIHESEAYDDVRRVLARLDETLQGFDGIRGGLADFLEVLPVLKEDAVDASARLRISLARIQEGLERFPEIAADTAFALEDARKVIESLKRNFLIRPNLPRDPDPESMAPAVLPRERARARALDASPADDSSKEGPP